MLEWSRADTTSVLIDIGGTHLRVASFNTSTGLLIERELPTACLIPVGEDVQLEGFCQRLLDEVEPVVAQVGARSVGVSLGAAINQLTGEVLASGPMWGSRRPSPVDLSRFLETQTDGVAWYVVNDLTAHALGIVPTAEAVGHSRFAVLNVGTGIAMRTFDIGLRGFWVDGTSGLQGEVGHLPAVLTIDGQLVPMKCECGAWNHLSAYCSGAVLPRVLAQIAPRFGALEAGDRVRQFRDELANEHPEAINLLEQIFAPLAGQVRQIFAIDPSIEALYLTGGVVDGLGAPLHRYLSNEYRDNAAPYSLSSDAWTREMVLRSPPRTALWGALHYLRLREAPISAPATWLLRSTRVTESRIVLAAPGQSAEDNWRECDDLASSVLMVVDAGVPTTTADDVRSALEVVGANVSIVTIEIDEPSKTTKSVNRVLASMVEVGIPRRGLGLVGLGGGVLLDVVGFAASQYRRGVSYARVPTTLLAMIDAAVGLKVGANLMGHRNMIGAFHPASLALICPAYLRGLPTDELRSGLGEALKIALIQDERLFEMVEECGAQMRRSAHVEVPEELFARSVHSMLAELCSDPFETDLRRAVDLGHTFIAALERPSPAGMRHGEAVAVDVAITVALSEIRGLLTSADANRVYATCRACRINRWHESITTDALVRSAQQAAAHRSGTHIPLLTGIGRAPTFVDDITRSELATARGQAERGLTLP